MKNESQRNWFILKDYKTRFSKFDGSDRLWRHKVNSFKGRLKGKHRHEHAKYCRKFLHDNPCCLKNGWAQQTFNKLFLSKEDHCFTMKIATDSHFFYFWMFQTWRSSLDQTCVDQESISDRTNYRRVLTLLSLFVFYRKDSAQLTQEIQILKI